ncbi:hypothetical protein ACFQ60_38360 [Streptomyces zhihengii]
MHGGQCHGRHADRPLRGGFDPADGAGRPVRAGRLRRLPAASVSPSPPPSRKPSPTPPSRKPGPAPTRTTAEPRPSPSPTPRTSTPAPPPPTQGAGADGAEAGCAEGGSGVHTIDSEGGKATVRFGSGGVCLISAVPSQGFTASTRQSAPQALTVTFAADRHRSEITASTEPSDRASVRETSF